MYFGIWNQGLPDSIDLIKQVYLCMFSEKLIIKNFGPFTEQVEFEFNKYSVIIGPQASGKSIVAKLITIFRNSRLVDYFEESLKNFNIAIFISKDTEIYYYSDIYSAKFFKGATKALGSVLYC